MNRIESRHVEILRHALGLDDYGQGNSYRNYFVTGEGSKDYPFCRDLVEHGYMARRAPSALTGGDDLFVVTAEGKAFAARSFDGIRITKLTRSERRYLRFLAADSNLSFRDWLRTEAGA